VGGTPDGTPPSPSRDLGAGLVPGAPTGGVTAPAGASAARPAAATEAAVAGGSLTVCSGRDCGVGAWRGVGAVGDAWAEAAATSAGDGPALTLAGPDAPDWAIGWLMLGVPAGPIGSGLIGPFLGSV